MYIDIYRLYICISYCIPVYVPCNISIDVETKVLAKERQKKDNHNLSKFFKNSTSYYSY